MKWKGRPWGGEPYIYIYIHLYVQSTYRVQLGTFCMGTPRSVRGCHYCGLPRESILVSTSARLISSFACLLQSTQERATLGSKRATSFFVLQRILMPSNNFENLSLQPRHLRFQREVLPPSPGRTRACIESSQVSRLLLAEEGHVGLKQCNFVFPSANNFDAAERVSKVEFGNRDVYFKRQLSKLPTFLPPARCRVCTYLESSQVSSFRVSWEELGKGVIPTLSCLTFQNDGVSPLRAHHGRSASSIEHLLGSIYGHRIAT